MNRSNVVFNVVLNLVLNVVLNVVRTSQWYNIPACINKIVDKYLIYKCKFCFNEVPFHMYHEIE